MANITASLVKELREITQVGMMECKQALVETNGDLEQAIEYLRKKGKAKAEKKAGRTAAEGLIGVAIAKDGKSVSVVEVNSETDFVAKQEDFVAFLNKVAEVALENKLTNVEELSAKNFSDGLTIEQRRLELVTKIGENINIRRAAHIESKDGSLAAYVHGGGNSSRIISIICLSNNDKDLAYDLAMHVAAMKPEYVNVNEIPAERVEKEKEILLAQAQEQQSDKPKEILEKIITGKLNKFTKEITLLGQNFVKDPDTTVEKLLNSKGATVVNMVRFEVGEGIEKEVTNFAEEVMSQVKG